VSEPSPGPFLALTGPTAVGKTALSLDLAERLGAEIVSVDSRQVYRGLRIGTAAPSAAERARVPHHFVHERGLDEPFSAGQFADAAAQRIADILGRGRVPLAVGGSTLYLEALVHGLADLPPVEPDVQAELEAHCADPLVRNRLYDELRAADPVAAESLDPSKTHRLIRFVGLLRSGIRPSEAWRNAPPPPYRFRVVVLDRPRADLYTRIERRVDDMLAGGLLDENRALLHRGAPLDVPALRTIGYQEPLAFLRGDITEDEMVSLLKRNSRRYAKRQLTWFRRHAEYVWLDAETATPERVLDAVRAGLGDRV
jgi:tRNA dimethylallyltransferase